MVTLAKDWLLKVGLQEGLADALIRAALFALVLLLAYVANFIAKRLFLRFVRRVAEKSKTHWDDALIRRNVFTRLSHLAPALVIYLAAPAALAGAPAAIDWVQRLSRIYMVFVGGMVIDALLTALIDVYRTYPISQRLPIKAFVDAVKVIIYFFVAILTLSILLNTRMTVFFTGLGALTVVLMLVFKDTILNFVAGIQLSANNMVRVGDWLEMPRYGADGDVIDISLTTVRVQNWDKTVSTIPPYALVTDAFKNWRGMSESGGRRIKRAINIDMTSVRICDTEMLERFANIQHIAEHIERKRKEVAEHNLGLNVSDDDLANGRHLTNLGTFRAYVEAFLRNHPKIHQEMTFLVRQLPSTDKGLPIEIYVFSNDQVWANYEAIQADIFDHIIAILPLFDLRVFQAPTGADMRGLAEIAR
jgi:miniconductance mechanosensitive channel